MTIPLVIILLKADGIITRFTKLFTLGEMRSLSNIRTLMPIYTPNFILTIGLVSVTNKIKKRNNNGLN